MKKALLILVCALAITALLAGCGLPVSLNGVGTRYDVNDVKELDAAGADSIKISTVSDDIVLKSGGDRVVAELTGECRSTSKPVWLDARRSGDSIIIDVEYPIGLTNCNTLLVVTIPESFAGDLETGAVSGDVEAEGLPFKLQDVHAHTISGTVNVSTASFASMKAETTSGAINVSNIAARTEARSISGNISLDYDAFAETVASTVSGGVEAAIPLEAAFSIRFESVSGNFNSTHTGVAADRADGGFQADANGGGDLLRVDTTSGGFRLTGK